MTNNSKDSAKPDVARLSVMKEFLLRHQSFRVVIGSILPLFGWFVYPVTVGARQYYVS